MRGLQRTPHGPHPAAERAAGIPFPTLEGEPMKKVRLAMLSAAMFLGMATVAYRMVSVVTRMGSDACRAGRVD